LLLKTDTAEQRWTPYIDKTSEHYKKLMEISDKQGTPFIVGEIGYFKVLRGAVKIKSHFDVAGSYNYISSRGCEMLDVSCQTPL
jgi:hypothetical protein